MRRCEMGLQGTDFDMLKASEHIRHERYRDVGLRPIIGRFAGPGAIHVGNLGDSRLVDRCCTGGTILGIGRVLQP
jgi:hypothetical protein